VLCSEGLTATGLACLTQLTGLLLPWAVEEQILLLLPLLLLLLR
jgi:hypothetical protein